MWGNGIQLVREVGGTLVYGVPNFQYMVLTLDQTDNDWTEVQWNAKRAHRFWGIFGKILRREGVEPKVEAMLYRAVTQAVLLFGLENCVLLSEMKRTVEGTHTGFLRKITGKRVCWKADRTWLTPKAGVVQEAVGTYSEMTYIVIR